MALDPTTVLNLVSTVLGGKCRILAAGVGVACRRRIIILCEHGYLHLCEDNDGLHLILRHGDCVSRCTGGECRIVYGVEGCEPTLGAARLLYREVLRAYSIAG